MGVATILINFGLLAFAFARIFQTMMARSGTHGAVFENSGFGKEMICIILALAGLLMNFIPFKFKYIVTACLAAVSIALRILL